MDSLHHFFGPLLTWLHFHPYSTALFTFMVAFLESLALFGLLLPGSVILAIIGTFVGAGFLPAKMVIGPAIAGAILGDLASYAIGFFYKERIRELWPFRSYPLLLQKGEQFFERHGGKSVLLGRFAGPMRPITPLIAGMLKMNFPRFLLADILSGIGWAVGYLIPGILLGAASTELAPQMASRALFGILFLIVGVWLIVWIIRHTFRWLTASLAACLNRLWQYAEAHPSLQKFCHLLKNKNESDGHIQLGWFLALIFSGVAFLILMLNVLHGGLLTHWNEPLHALMRSLHTNLLEALMLLVGYTVEPKGLLFVALISLAWLVFKRDWRAAWHLALVFFGAAVSAELIKHGIHSARPSGLLQTPSGFSFPSGHTTMALVLLGFTSILLRPQVSPATRQGLHTFAIVWVLLIAFARVYLGAHWLTDVIGAILLGLFWVSLGTLSYWRTNTKPFHAKSFLSILIISLLACTALFGIKDYRKQYQDFQLYRPILQISPITWWQTKGTLLVPTYRNNRLGQPIQLLNIQWYAPLSDILKMLKQQDFEVYHEYGLRGTLRKLSGIASTEPHGLPLFGSLYRDQHPMLVLTKRTAYLDIELVIHLWNSEIQISNSIIPLWIGNISYYGKELHIPNNHPLSFPDPIHVLQKTLVSSEWQWQTVNVSLPTSVMHALHLQNNPEILLIRSR